MVEIFPIKGHKGISCFICAIVHHSTPCHSDRPHKNYFCSYFLPQMWRPQQCQVLSTDWPDMIALAIQYMFRFQLMSTPSTLCLLLSFLPSFLCFFLLKKPKPMSQFITKQERKEGRKEGRKVFLKLSNQ